MARFWNVFEGSVRTEQGVGPIITRQSRQEDSWSEFPGETAIKDIPVMPSMQAGMDRGDIYRISFASRISATDQGRLFNPIGEAFYTYGPQAILKYILRAHQLGCKYFNILSLAGRHMENTNEWNRNAMTQVPVGSLSRRQIMHLKELQRVLQAFGMELSIYFGVGWTVWQGSLTEGQGFVNLTPDNFNQLSRMIQYCRTTLGVRHIVMDQVNWWWSVHDMSYRNRPDQMEGPQIPALGPWETNPPFKTRGRALYFTQRLREEFPDVQFIFEGHPPQTMVAHWVDTGGIVSRFENDYRDRPHWKRDIPRLVYDPIIYPGSKRYCMITGGGTWPKHEFDAALGYLRGLGYGIFIDYNQDPEWED